MPSICTEHHDLKDLVWKGSHFPLVEGNPDIGPRFFTIEGHCGRHAVRITGYQSHIEALRDLCNRLLQEADMLAHGVYPDPPPLTDKDEAKRVACEAEEEQRQAAEFFHNAPVLPRDCSGMDPNTTGHCEPPF